MEKALRNRLTERRRKNLKKIKISEYFSRLNLNPNSHQFLTNILKDQHAHRQEIENFCNPRVNNSHTDLMNILREQEIYRQEIENMLSANSGRDGKEKMDVDASILNSCEDNSDVSSMCISSSEDGNRDKSHKNKKKNKKVFFSGDVFVIDD